MVLKLIILASKTLDFDMSFQLSQYIYIVYTRNSNYWTIITHVGLKKNLIYKYIKIHFSRHVIYKNILDLMKRFSLTNISIKQINPYDILKNILCILFIITRKTILTEKLNVMDWTHILFEIHLSNENCLQRNYYGYLTQRDF